MLLEYCKQVILVLFKQHRNPSSKPRRANVFGSFFKKNKIGDN
jgi:hypothetical protein